MNEDDMVESLALDEGEVIRCLAVALDAAIAEQYRKAGVSPDELPLLTEDMVRILAYFNGAAIGSIIEAMPKGETSDEQINCLARQTELCMNSMGSFAKVLQMVINSANLPDDKEDASEQLKFH